MSDEPPPLRVRVLGGLAVDGLTDAELGSRKARTLVKVLVLARGSPVTVHELAEILWHGSPPERPGEQIGVLASRLRRAVGPHRLIRSDRGFALTVDWLDIDDMSALVHEAAGALRDGRVGAARAASSAAIELDRGPLLPDDDGEWIEADRTTSAALRSRARSLAAEAALRAGDHVGAELAAESAIASDPYDEASLRVLMRAQAAAGRPASALACYAKMRHRLVEDLGVSPDRETEAVHTALLSGRPDVGPTPTPSERGFVGRQSEVAALEAHLAAVHDVVRLVVLTGEAGIGKTTIVHEFARRVREVGIRIVMARSDELGRDLPLQPILDVLGSSTRQQLGIEPGSATAIPDTRSARSRWFAAVLEQLAPGPAKAVLVIDDVHSADPATREWLGWVHGHPGPLLVLAVTQPGETVRGAHELVVSPFDPVEIGALIGDGDPAQVATVHERSGGNPLFALAIAGAAGEDPPRSVQHAVASTLARLDPTDEELVRAAAVLDAAGDVDLLGGVLRRPVIEVIGRLERAASIGLLVEAGPGYEFRHPLVREALAATTGVARAALLHREAAHVLDGRPTHDPLRVAVHARMGGATDIAAQAFLDAALDLSRMQRSGHGRGPAPGLAARGRDGRRSPRPRSRAHDRAATRRGGRRGRPGSGLGRGAGIVGARGVDRVLPAPVRARSAAGRRSGAEGQPGQRDRGERAGPGRTYPAQHR